MIEYFGTDLRSAGHYFWELDRGFNRSRRRFESVPFNPEGLPYAGTQSGCPKRYKDGTVRFYNFAGFTICAIAGSPSDDRPGCKSVFFVEEDLTRDVFEARLTACPEVLLIIKQMPFPVLW